MSEGNERERTALNQSQLYTKEQMGVMNMPNWVKKTYAQYKRVVEEPGFPCFFGQKEERRGNVHYSYLCHNDWVHLPTTLQEFISFTKTTGNERSVFLLFVEPESKVQPFAYYRRYFWDVLTYLNRKDKEEWPVDIPTDPDHHLWSFCFASCPMFVFGNAPAYQKRRARNLGKSLVLGFQPRNIFKGLEGTLQQGREARDKIRKKAEKWDGIATHPDVGYYGDPTHHEWKQFFISDDCEPIQGKCPFQVSEMRDGK